MWAFARRLQNQEYRVIALVELLTPSKQDGTNQNCIGLLDFERGYNFFLNPLRKVPHSSSLKGIDLDLATNQRVIRGLRKK